MSTQNDATRIAIGRYVRSERQSRGMEAAELGKRVDRHADTIYRIERGECNDPGACTLERIANVFGESIGEFFQEVEEIKEHV